MPRDIFFLSVKEKKKNLICTNKVIHLLKKEFAEKLFRERWRNGARCLCFGFSPPALSHCDARHSVSGGSLTSDTRAGAARLVRLVVATSPAARVHAIQPIADAPEKPR